MRPYSFRAKTRLRQLSPPCPCPYPAQGGDHHPHTSRRKHTVSETNRTATAQWKRFRQSVIRSAGRSPACHWCGTDLNPKASRGERGAIEIDHILPVVTHPHLEYDRENVAISCQPCNRRKGKGIHEKEKNDPKPPRTYVTWRTW